jgi:hypothetical protein
LATGRGRPRRIGRPAQEAGPPRTTYRHPGIGPNLWTYNLAAAVVDSMSADDIVKEEW